MTDVRSSRSTIDTGRLGEPEEMSSSGPKSPDKFVEQIPSSVLYPLVRHAAKLPAEILGSVDEKGKVGTAESAVKAVLVFRGNWIKAFQAGNKVKAALGTEVGKDADANKILQSRTVAALFGRPEVWQELSRSKEELLSVLDPKLHSRLDKFLADQIEAKPVVTLETGRRLLSTVSKSKDAKQTLSTLVTDATVNLKKFLMESQTVGKLLTEQGITDPKVKEQAIDAMLPIVAEAMLHLETISEVANFMSSKDKLTADDASDIALKLLPIVTSEAGKALLQNKNLESILKPVLEKKLAETGRENSAGVVAHQAAGFLHQMVELEKSSLEELIRGGSSAAKTKKLDDVTPEALDIMSRLVLSQVKRLLDDRNRLAKLIEGELHKTISDPAEREMLGRVAVMAGLPAMFEAIKDPQTQGLLLDCAKAYQLGDDGTALKAAAVKLLESGKLGSVIHAAAVGMNSLDENEKASLEKFMSALATDGVKAMLQTEGLLTTDVMPESLNGKVNDLVSTLMGIFLRLPKAEGSVDAINHILQTLPGLIDPKKSPAEKVALLQSIQKMIASSDDAEPLFQALIKQVAEISGAHGQGLEQLLQSKLLEKIPDEKARASVSRAAVVAGVPAALKLIKDVETRRLLSKCADAYAADSSEKLQDAASELLKSNRLGSVIHVWATKMKELSEEERRNIREFTSSLVNSSVEAKMKEAGFADTMPDPLKQNLVKLVDILMTRFHEIASAPNSADSINMILKTLPEFADPKLSPADALSKLQMIHDELTKIGLTSEDADNILKLISSQIREVAKSHLEQTSPLIADKLKDVPEATRQSLAKAGLLGVATASSLIEDEESRKALMACLDAYAQNPKSETQMREAVLDLIRTGKLGSVIHTLSTGMGGLSADDKTSLQKFVSDMVIKAVESELKLGKDKHLSEAVQKNMNSLVSTLMSLSLKLGSSKDGAVAIDRIIATLPALANPKFSGSERLSFALGIEEQIRSLIKSTPGTDKDVNNLFKTLAAQIREVAKSHLEQVASQTENPSLAKAGLLGLASASTLIEDEDASKMFLACATAHANGDEAGLKAAAFKLLKSGKLGSVIHDFAQRAQMMSVEEQSAIKNFISTMLATALKPHVDQVSSNTEGNISNLVETLMKLSISVGADKGSLNRINQILSELPNLDGSDLEKINSVENIMGHVRAMALVLTPSERSMLKSSLDPFLDYLFADMGVPTMTTKSAGELSSMLLDEKKSKDLLAFAKYQKSDEHGVMAKFFNLLSFGLSMIFSGRLSISTLLSLNELRKKRDAAAISDQLLKQTQEVEQKAKVEARVKALSEVRSVLPLMLDLAEANIRKEVQKLLPNVDVVKWKGLGTNRGEERLQNLSSAELLKIFKLLSTSTNSVVMGGSKAQIIRLEREFS